VLVPEIHRILKENGILLVLVPNRKGFDYGVRIEIGHVLYVTETEINALRTGRFSLKRHYPYPFPRWIGRHFLHNKEVFELKKIPKVDQLGANPGSE